MPLYEFQCDSCSERFEELRSAAATDAPPCPSCGSTEVVRIFSSFGTRWRPSNVNWHRV